MLAKLERKLPERDGMLYEPKWDGFRCIVFRDGDDVVLGSRNERPLTRYFPELVSAITANVPPRCVLDGEIVIVGPSGLDFEALLQRIHPAESRIRKLAEATPASFVAFDILALGDEDLRGRPFSERRHCLEEALGAAEPPVHVTPATASVEVARDWFARFEGAGLDGVIAKGGDLHYLENQRVMTKVKHRADGGLRRGRVSLAQERRQGRVPPPRPVRRRRGSPPRRRDVVVHRRPSVELVSELEPYRVATMDGHPWSWGAEAAPDASAGPPRAARRRRRLSGVRAHRAAGTPAVTSPSSPSAPSSCVRSATTTSRATGSATVRRFAAGAPIARRSPVATTS